VRFHIGQRTQLSERQMVDIARYRHTVFVEALGWSLPCRDGLEVDQFDCDSTVYVFAEDEEQRVIAFARLLPTTHPYPLAQLFPELLDGREPPCCADTWELSRFSATGAGIADDAASSPLAIALLDHALYAAELVGARRLITVSPIAIEGLLRKAGFRSSRFAGPVRCGAKRLVVCDIGVPENRPARFADAPPPARPPVDRPRRAMASANPELSEARV
jgi:acyl homoserine lactone synthase